MAENLSVHRIKDIVFESALVANSIADSQGIITNMNSAFLKLWGYRTKEEAEGHSVASFFVNEPDAVQVLEALNAVGTWEGEFLAKRADGSTFISRGYATVVRDETGKQIGYYSACVDVTEERLNFETLRKTKELLSTVLNNAPITIFAIDNQGIFTLSEGKNLDKVNLKPGENVGVSATDLFGKLSVIQPGGETINGGEVIQRVLAGETLKGITELGGVYFDNQFVPNRNAQGKIIGMIGVATIITERLRAEEKILKLNRIYAVISQINQAIMRVREKDKILSEACRIAVEHGKFQMAWIGMIDEKTNRVNPVTYSGVEDGYLSKIKSIYVEDVPEGRGPTGTAIREGRHNVCDDIEKDPRMALWREEALKRGYRSSIALPINHFGKVIGAFSIYSSCPHFFDQEEIHLLDEVTNDISFALESIEISKKMQEAEEALRRSERELNESQRVTQVGSWQWIIASDTITWSPGYYRIIGRDLALPPPNYKEHLKMYKQESRGRLEAAVSETLKNGIPYELDLEFLHPDGSRRFMVARGEAVHDTAGQVVMLRGTLQDITQRKKAEEELQRYREHLEELVKERTAQLNQKYEELERFNRLFVGRELRMIELKKKITDFEKKIAELEKKVGGGK